MANNKPIWRQNINFTYYKLDITQSLLSTNITMYLLISVLNTKDLVNVCPLLEKELPSIFSAVCINDFNIPFRKEVLQTEIGHLFEHILLEHLCKFKNFFSGKDCEYSGETSWNWNTDPRGTFHIEINIGYKDNKVLLFALQKSVVLMNRIITESNIPKNAIITNNNLIKTKEVKLKGI